MQYDDNVLFLAGALPAFTGPWWLGTPWNVTGVVPGGGPQLFHAEQHLPSKSLSPDTHGSANSAEKAPSASEFQSHSLDLRNKGAGCRSEGGAGGPIRSLC